MRREMQEIIPHLWLGPYASALKAKVCLRSQLFELKSNWFDWKAEELSRVGITHIICVRQEIESHWIRPNFADKYHYLTLDIADSPTQNIIQHFPRVNWFFHLFQIIRLFLIERSRNSLTSVWHKTGPF